MDITNLWAETGDVKTDDINIIKTWLCNGSDGQTYPISDRFLVRIKDNPDYEYDFGDIEGEWDEIIGWKHDYKLNDPDLDIVAHKIYNGLTEFINKVNTNPGNYFRNIHEDDSSKLNSADNNTTPKKYWIASYRELEEEDGAFGAICGMIYETQDEAWNAILKDAEEYLSCFNKDEAVIEKCESAWNVIVKNPKTGKTLCEWEPQCLWFSKDVNDLD